MSDKKIWAVRSGPNNEVDHIFMTQGQIALRFPGIGDPSTLPASREALKQAFNDAGGIERPEAIAAQAGQLYRFMHEMSIGDHILYPRRSDRSVCWGMVSGPYMFERDVTEDFFHRRSVRWLGKAARERFSQGALYEIGANHNLFEVKTHAQEFLAQFRSDEPIVVERTPMLDEQSVVRDIIDTTRDFIAKRIRSDLRGFRLENFIADLFRAMGYRAGVTQKVKDDGIDVIAHRDELGIEPPLLKIQVKSSETIIGPDKVKAFYAMVHERDVGIFITTSTFSSGAIEFARSRGNLKLMNGVELIELIQKYYDRLDTGSRRMIPLRQILVPDLVLDHE